MVVVAVGVTLEVVEVAEVVVVMVAHVMVVVIGAHHAIAVEVLVAGTCVSN